MSRIVRFFSRHKFPLIVFVAALFGVIVISRFADAAGTPVSAVLYAYKLIALDNVNGAPNTTNGAWVQYDGQGANGGTRKSDAAPLATALTASSAWSQATVNTSGANLNVAPGIGRRLIALTAANCAGDTVTVTENGSATVLTEGAQWNRGASNSAAATSLTAAINAVSGTGLVATASSGNVFIEKSANPLATRSAVTASFATSDGTCAAITQGADGTTNLWGSTTSNGVFTFNGQLNPATRDTGTGQTLTTASCGGTFINNAAGDAVTTFVLPAASNKCGFCFAADSVAGANRELDIATPAGSDLIVGTTTAAGGTGIATTAGASHGIKNTHATAVRGNGTCLRSDGVNTWYMFGISGIWAAF